MERIPRAIDETLLESNVETGDLENDLIMILEDIKKAQQDTIRKIKNATMYKSPVDGFLYENLKGEYLPVGPNLDMHGFDLRGLVSKEPVDVHNSDLREANLIGVDLSNWNLKGANLNGAVFCDPSDFEDMQDKVPDGYLLLEDGTLIEYTG